MEHDLIVLIGCVQGVSPRGIRCKNKIVRPIVQLLPSIFFSDIFCVVSVLFCFFWGIFFNAREDTISP